MARGIEIFIARVDSSSLEDLTPHELRTRIELLDAELEQLAHDKEHVEVDCYGMEKFQHLRGIERDSLSARAKKARYTVELGARDDIARGRV